MHRMVRERVAKEDRLGNLAEFGCGTGFDTQVLVSKADSVVATDLSSRMLGLAKERIRRWPSGRRGNPRSFTV
jgi:predicted TPR repeat methyltransferase